MLTSLKEIRLLYIIIAFLISCSKGEGSENSLQENPVDKNIIQTDNSIEVGTGSGDLTIDGRDQSLKEKSLILIKEGIYGSVSIKNLKGTQKKPIAIKNAGQVIIESMMTVDNVAEVTIAGDYIKELQYGITLHDISFRSMTISGEFSGLTLSNISFKNVGDYVIYIKPSNDNETGTERIKILNCKFDNVGGLQFKGDFSSDQDDGFIKDLEIAYNTFINSDVGAFVFVPNVQDYDVHHNIVNNVNSSNNNHNGIFQMIGNGKFHDNIFTNYQGNMIRAWVFSRGTSPATVEFFNNIAYNTRKYGAFEIQGFDRYLISGKTTVVNAKVYNNTVGKMNTSKDWEGGVLDLYNYGGTLEYYNNLGFDLKLSKQFTDMINNMSNTKIIKNTNNKYFESASEAVVDLESFASKYSGIGANR